MTTIQRVLVYAGAAVVAAYFLYPLYVLLLVGFAPVQYTLDKIYPAQFTLHYTLANLVTALTSYGFIDPLIKSLKTAFLVGGLSVALGFPAGYGLSRVSKKVSSAASTTLFVVNMMPAIVIAIPISTQFVRLGLYGSFVGVGLAQELVALPLATFIIYGTFQAIPRELEYQARIDGAGVGRTMLRVLAPLAKPGIAAAFLLSWMLSWDEFTFAILLSPVHPTIPILIYHNIQRGNLLASTAFALFLTLPVVAITIMLQKYLKGEYLSGGVKG